MTAEQELTHALRTDQFSGVVRVVYRGACLLEYTAGLTRPGSGEPTHDINAINAINPINPIHADTRFATASVTKMYTAVCLARLVDQGLCRLDQSIAEFVPEAERFGDGMTLDTLLSHRSGLGDYIDDDADLPFAGFPVEELTRVDAFLPYVFEADRHEPDVFRYSSAGFILLGAVIEAVTKQTYPEAVSTWVCEPAGLRSTGFLRFDDTATDFAWGMLADDKPNIPHLPPIGSPDGGIVTNAQEIESFFNWLKSGRALSDTTRQTMWEPVSTLSDDEGYARGFDVMTIGGRTWLGHTGSDPGVSARVMFDPESDSFITVLCNRDSIAFRVFRLIQSWLDEQGWPPTSGLRLTDDADGAGKR